MLLRLALNALWEMMRKKLIPSCLFAKTKRGKNVLISRIQNIQLPFGFSRNGHYNKALTIIRFMTLIAGGLDQYLTVTCYTRFHWNVHFFHSRWMSNWTSSMTVMLKTQMRMYFLPSVMTFPALERVSLLFHSTSLMKSQQTSVQIRALNIMCLNERHFELSYMDHCKYQKCLFASIFSWDYLLNTLNYQSVWWLLVWEVVKG